MTFLVGWERIKFLGTWINHETWKENRPNAFKLLNYILSVNQEMSPCFRWPLLQLFRKISWILTSNKKSTTPFAWNEFDFFPFWRKRKEKLFVSLLVIGFIQIHPDTAKSFQPNWNRSFAPFNWFFPRGANNKNV